MIRFTVALAALLFLLAACGPAPTSSAQPSSPVPTADPSASVPSIEPTTAPTASPTIFSFDVENRSQVPVIVSIASDTGAVLPGFEPGQRGTISIPLLNPQNGIGVEVQGVGCQLLASGAFPTPAPFTLVVEDAVGAGNVQLSTVAGAASTPIPLPTNSLVGCGG
jgi:hypothetical protein